jgi:UDP-N-acetylmuramoyl-L-alanyl-D-glutamate--2,6-diaminopimelate ligase
VDLERLIAALGPSQVIGSRSASIRDLAYDTRAVEPGALFFCVPGERVDGHSFASEAVERGAIALVVERPLGVSVPQLVVADTRTSMASAAAEFFERPSHELTVAGVTGTSGKTTTSFLLFALFAAAGMRPGLLGTIETRVGGERRPAARTTAEAIDLQRVLREMVDVGDRSCAMEATSHGSELKRLQGVHFSALVFTNLGLDHLDLHGTPDRYFAAKRELFVGDDPPPAAVNISDEHGRALADELRQLDQAPVTTFGWADDADIRPRLLELSPAGARYKVTGLDIVSPLLGRFNVENVLGAVAAARLLGIADEAIEAGVRSVRGVPGRFEPVSEGQHFSVVVDYSHKPEALENALQTARGLAEGRVICVFGCGGDRDRSKRPLMGRIAAEASDLAIVTSDNPRSEDPQAIIGEILVGMAAGEFEVEPDRRLAIERAIAEAQAGDFVLIAGKGHERGQEIAGQVIPFDDREVAREALRRLGARR